MWDDGRYYATTCKVCGTWIQWPDEYCSDSCMYKGEEWTAEQIAAHKAKKNWQARVNWAKNFYAQLVEDEKQEMGNKLSQYKLSAYQLTDDVLEKILLEQSFEFEIQFPYRYEERKCQISVCLYDSNSSEHNGVELDVFIIDKPWIYMALYATRKSLIAFARSPEKLRAAILAVQDDKETEDFMWLEGRD